MANNIYKMLKLEELSQEENAIIEGKITNIQLTKSATISTAPYENLKPGYGMSIDTRGMTPAQMLIAYKIGNKILDLQMKIEAHNKLAEKLAMDSRVGFSMVKDIAYAWVSSICSFDIVWRMPPFELDQYACRGKLAEALFCNLLDGKPHPKKEEMEGFFKEKKLHESYAIMKNGSLGLTLEKLPIEKQYANVKDHITEIEYQVRVINDEYLYVGKADIFCKWDGIPTCLDIKATAQLPDYKQVALYAACRPGTQQIGYLPIGASDTKRGHQLIKMTKDIPREFKDAILKRNKFYKRFGF
jgi:hypothetical protein